MIPIRQKYLSGYLHFDDSAKEQLKTLTDLQ